MKITGSFHCKVFERDQLIKEFTGNNLVLDQGRRRLGTLLIANGPNILSKIGFGEGTSVPAVSDQFLTGTVYYKPVNVSTQVGDTVLTFDWVLGNSEANGINITEFGLMYDDDLLFARKTGLTVPKNNTITLTGTWTITIN